MSNSTSFTDYTTAIKADWLNDVNTVVFNDTGGPNFLGTTGGSVKIGTPPLSNLPGNTVAAQLSQINDVIGTGGGVAGVSSFNTRTGVVTLSCNDVATAFSSDFSTVQWSAGNSGNIVTRWNFLNAAPTGSSFSLYRQANYTGGTPGFTNHAFRTDTVVSAGATSYEWGITSVMDNYAGGGENVAGYFQGNRRATVGCATWGLVAEASDKNNVSAAETAAGLVGAEIDVFANGTDDYYRRIGINVVVGKANSGGAKAISGAAIMINAQNDDNTVGAFSVGVAVKSADGSSFLSSATGVRGMDLRGTYSLAIDTSLGTNTTSTALRIKSGDYICMDGSDNYGFKMNGSLLEFWNRTAGGRHGYIDLAAGADVDLASGGGGGGGGVTSFNTRTGAVTLSSSDVSSAGGVVTTGAQSIAGVKTFSNYIDATGGIVTAGVISNGNLDLGSYAMSFASYGNTRAASGSNFIDLRVLIDGSTYWIPVKG